MCACVKLLIFQANDGFGGLVRTVYVRLKLGHFDSPLSSAPDADRTELP